MIKSYLYYASEYIYKKVLPGALKIFLMRFINPGWHTLRAGIVRYLENELRETPDAEKEAVLEILRKNPVYFIPYEHNHVFPIHSIRVFRDAKGGKYVLHDGKRLFFPEDWDDFRIQTSYCALLREQNPRSPHRYETDSFCVRNGDIIVDCGAAEGIWALSSVEKAGKVYLVECDEKWIAALRKTFEPWEEKVEIADKFVSDKNSGGCVTLDDLLGGGGANFIKADIEGAEISMLRGAVKTLERSENLRLSLCAYHRQNDGRDLKEMLKARGFSAEYSDGYMLMLFGESPLEPPYLRRGVVRAAREQGCLNF
jgi:hypothetical protein